MATEDLGLRNDDSSSSQLVAVGQNVVVALGGLRQAILETFPNFVTVPANSTASGVAGQVAYDSTHFYWCVSSNSWVRVAGSTF